MKVLCNYSLPLICILTVLFTSECQPNVNKEFTVERSYSYTIRASISGNIFSGDGPTRFELKPRHLRRMKFRHLPEKPNAVMYAYRLTSKNEYNEKLSKDEVVFADIVEVAVSAPQADKLFSLAKAVFETVAVSNVDTVYTTPKMNTCRTDDASGVMSIASKYGNIQLDIGPLHSSNNRQGASFLSLYDGFEALFSEE